MHGRTPENSQTTFSTQQQLEWNHGTWLRQLLTGPSLGFVSAKEGGPTINLSPVGVTALNACAWGTCALLPCVEGCWRVCVCYWPLSFHEWLGNHLEIILALALISFDFVPFEHAAKVQTVAWTKHCENFFWRRVHMPHFGHGNQWYLRSTVKNGAPPSAVWQNPGAEINKDLQVPHSSLCRLGDQPKPRL